MRIQNVFPSGRCHWDNFVFSMVDRSPIFRYYWDHLRSLNFLDEVGLNLTPPLSRCTQSKPYSIHAIRIPSSSDCIIFRVDINRMKIKFLKTMPNNYASGILHKKRKVKTRKSKTLDLVSVHLFAIRCKVSLILQNIHPSLSSGKLLHENTNLFWSKAHRYTPLFFWGGGVKVLYVCMLLHVIILFNFLRIWHHQFVKFDVLQLYCTIAFELLYHCIWIYK